MQNSEKYRDEIAKNGILSTYEEHTGIKINDSAEMERVILWLASECKEEPKNITILNTGKIVINKL